MTEEEIEKQNEFENWYYKKYPVTLNIGEENRLEQMNDCFNAGAKWGITHAIEWHDVADGDLPEEGTEVLNDDGVKVVRINGHWRYVYGGEWEDDAYLDHWCELPKFKAKESEE